MFLQHWPRNQKNMQISTYLWVPLSAVLAWQCTQPFLCKAMEISSILGRPGNFLEAVVKNQMGSSLNRPLSGEWSLSIGKVGVGEKKCPYPRFSKTATQGCLEFFFSFSEGSKSLKLTTAKATCHIYWKSAYWYHSWKYKLDNQSPLHNVDCVRVKNRFDVPPTCIINM